MIGFKNMKSMIRTTGIALGISCLISSNAYAATYTTVSGDSLFKISQLFHTTINNLISDNNLESTSLKIGQSISVPCLTYSVQKGDSLFLIAQRHNTPLETIRRANHIYIDAINIGQILIIPIFSSSVSPSAPATAPVVAPQSAPTVAPATTSQSSPVISRSSAPRSAPTVAPAAPPQTTPAIAPATEATYSASDLDLLSRLITAEAQGEPYDAKVAVGAVVINRVKSDSFPDTMREVIYQKINGYFQFTPVKNGWIDKPADEDSIKAAKAALSGVDPTNDALFYYDDSTTSTYMLSKQVSIKISNMIFAY